jgi:TPR repeat protein
MKRNIKTFIALVLVSITAISVSAQTEDSIAMQKFEALKAKAEALRVQADMGDVEAQYNLGRCYYEGLGVIQNVQQALALFSKAANAGYAPAQNRLGKAYEEGDFGNPNEKEAKKWYTLAATQGFSEAMFNLGNICVDGYFNFTAEAVKWFAKAAGQGFAPAMFNLGLCYEQGYGVKKNPATALQWYIQASENGHFEAKEAVSRLGEGAASDY